MGKKVSWRECFVRFRIYWMAINDKLNLPLAKIDSLLNEA